MGKKELVANRRYTDEFKVEAVKLGESIGGNQAAKRLGIPESSLWNWTKLSRAGKLKAAVGAPVAVKRSVTDVEAENVRNSLKRQELRPLYKRPYRVTTDSAHHKPIAANVLDRRFDGWEVNQAWVARMLDDYVARTIRSSGR